MPSFPSPTKSIKEIIDEQKELGSSTPATIMPSMSIPSSGASGGASLTAWTKITVYPKGKKVTGRIGRGAGGGGAGSIWVLPLPADLADMNSLLYEPASFNVGQRTLAAGTQDIFNNDKAAFIQDIENSVANAGIEGAAGEVAAGILPQGMNDVLFGGRGLAPNPNMEALFKGANLRTFQFSWALTPLKKEDSEGIKKFIKEIKKIIYPSYDTGMGGRGQIVSVQNFPAEFEVAFYSKGITGGEQLIFATIICACSELTVNYSQNGGFYPHEDGSPNSVTINMSFQELYTLSQDDIDEISSQ